MGCSLALEFVVHPPVFDKSPQVVYLKAFGRLCAIINTSILSSFTLE